MRELQLASRADLRGGVGIVVLLSCITIAIFTLLDMRPGLLIWAGLFWGVVRIVRGFRFRREAWQLDHLGFIQRERDQARELDERRRSSGARQTDPHEPLDLEDEADKSEFGFVDFVGVIGFLLLFHSFIYEVKWIGLLGAVSVLPMLWKRGSVAFRSPMR